MKMLEVGGFAIADVYQRIEENAGRLTYTGMRTVSLTPECREALKAALLAMSEAEPDESVVEAAAKAMCVLENAKLYAPGSTAENVWKCEPQDYWRSHARAAIKAALKEMAG